MSKLAYIKLGWLFIFLLVTIPLVVTYNSTTHRDNDIVLGYAQIALTFPTGPLVLGYLAEALDLLFSIQLPAGRLGMTLFSVGFLTVGYLQWFVVLPALWRLLTNLLARATGMRSKPPQ